MELAIPLLALGSMYIISNNRRGGQQRQEQRQEQQQQQQQQQQEQLQSHQSIKESYENMGASTSYLPNTNIPAQNYPVLNENDVIDNVAHYVNPNVATDKYFNQHHYETEENNGLRVGNNIQEMYSLTGDFVDKSNFKHNNMVPFYGAKIKGQVYGENMAETILDNMVGSGSQVIKKIEQAPLFKPQDNVQWAYGAPNSSDFYQSRVNPGMKNSNIKPFETENVGPGLNQGYSTEGTGGFNSGMEARDLWLPKTVDELRIQTNPKLEYSLENHEGPSYAYVKNLGIEGKVEKYHPDTFFIQNQDRWLTTTGQEKGQMLQPIQEIGDTTRATTTAPYAGIAAKTEKNAGYVPPSFEISKRQEFQSLNAGPSHACNRGTHHDKDNALRSHAPSTNNRAILRQPDTMRSGFSSAIGAVIAPLMDFIKPSRKEEFSSNIRIYGNGESAVSKGYTINPNDTTHTTIKQTTLFTPNLFMGNQAEQGVGGYKVADQQPIQNQRDTTNCSTLGNAGGASNQWGDRSYNADYMQHNNVLKEQVVVHSGRTNQGNTNIFNQQMNVSIGKRDSDSINIRPLGNVSVLTQQIPISASQYGEVRGKQGYEQINCTRIEPSILDAFKSNPYVQSLQSY